LFCYLSESILSANPQINLYLAKQYTPFLNRGRKVLLQMLLTGECTSLFFYLFDPYNIRFPWKQIKSYIYRNTLGHTNNLFICWYFYVYSVSEYLHRKTHFVYMYMYLYTTYSFLKIPNLFKGSNGTTINIIVLNTYHNLNTYTEKHFLKHK